MIASARTYLTAYEQAHIVDTCKVEFCCERNARHYSVQVIRHLTVNLQLYRSKEQSKSAHKIFLSCG